MGVDDACMDAWDDGRDVQFTSFAGPLSTRSCCPLARFAVAVPESNWLTYLLPTSSSSAAAGMWAKRHKTEAN